MGWKCVAQMLERRFAKALKGGRLEDGCERMTKRVQEGSEGTVVAVRKWR